MYNPWKENLKDTPKESLNWRLWYGVFVFGLMGAARGIDEGLIGTTAELEPFKIKFGLDDKHKSKHEKAELLSNITSMVQMGKIVHVRFVFETYTDLAPVRLRLYPWSDDRLLPYRQDWPPMGYTTALSCLGRWYFNLPCILCYWKYRYDLRRSIHRGYRHRTDYCRRTNLPRGDRSTSYSWSLRLCFFWLRIPVSTTIS
jgi:hypothetical protein